MNTLDQMKQDARGHNKYLVENPLFCPVYAVTQIKEIITILNNCHPTNRDQYTRQLEKQELITKEEAKQI